MAKKTDRFTGFLLQLALGLYFLIQGIYGFMDYDSDFSRLQRSVTGFFGSQGIPWNLIISVIQLAAGIILLVFLFVHIRRQKGFQFVFGTVFTVLWLIFMIMNYFFQSFLEPSTLVWLSRLSQDTIILAGLWVVAHRDDIG